ncbi:MAG TPA: hypothetical protein VLV78_23050 [Thermoanaerobaculia bacterium]|nr:hypothetical protein [Thermoanaerobaculia bacterium]
MLNVRADAKQTAVENCGRPNLLGTFEEPFIGESAIANVVVTESDSLSAAAVVAPFRCLSGKYPSFKASLVMRSPASISVIYGGQASRVFAVFSSASCEIYRTDVSNARGLCSAPSESSSTTETSKISTAIEADLRESLTGLRSLVAAITRRELLMSNEQFDRILREAARHQGKLDDVDGWADRLANDADRLND